MTGVLSQTFPSLPCAHTLCTWMDKSASPKFMLSCMVSINTTGVLCCTGNGALLVVVILALFASVLLAVSLPGEVNLPARRKARNGLLTAVGYGVEILDKTCTRRFVCTY